MTKDSKLFYPISVGAMQLQHRVVMCPLTRFRADESNVHHELPIEYYSQRSSEPGTLLVTEGTFISQDASGYTSAPGIWNNLQIEAWKKITDAVHANKSFIFCQLWALGRAARPEVLEKVGHIPVGPSAIPVDPTKPAPRELSADDIQEYAKKYAKAAENAMKAGFDGVEIHGANGYLIDQFLQTNSNARTDAYGGSIENRCRFALEVIAAVTAVVGEQKTAIRLSPWSTFNGMGMEDPKPTFSHLVQEISSKHSGLAYISLIEPRISGDDDAVPAKYTSPPTAALSSTPASPVESNAFLEEIWSPRILLKAGGYTADISSASRECDEKGNILCGFGRAFIANPDLVYRLKNSIPLNPYDRSTFYLRGPAAKKGYVDYPFAEMSAETASPRL